MKSRRASDELFCSCRGLIGIKKKKGQEVRRRTCHEKEKGGGNHLMLTQHSPDGKLHQITSLCFLFAVGVSVRSIWSNRVTTSMTCRY